MDDSGEKITVDFFKRQDNCFSHSEKKKKKKILLIGSLIYMLVFGSILFDKPKPCFANPSPDRINNIKFYKQDNSLKDSTMIPKNAMIEIVGEETSSTCIVSYGDKTITEENETIKAVCNYARNQLIK